MTTEKKSKAGLWALLAKIGAKIFLGKMGFALLSFLSYIWMTRSWKFTLLLMFSIGFHESGHVWAMKKMGIKTKGFYFLPFIGGAAIAEDQYKTYGENSYIAIMGPVWGALLAGLCACGYWVTAYLGAPEPMLAAAAAWMATLNLFNLLPITPLDGGQLMRAIAFSVHKNLGVLFLALSLLFAGFIMWKLHIGLFVLILAIGAGELFFEVRHRLRMAKVRAGTLSKWLLPSDHLDSTQEDGLKRYPDSMNKKQLALTIVAYAGTIAVLITLLHLMQGVPEAGLAKQFLE